MTFCITLLTFGICLLFTEQCFLWYLTYEFKLWKSVCSQTFCHFDICLGCWSVPPTDSYQLIRVFTPALSLSIWGLWSWESKLINPFHMKLLPNLWLMPHTYSYYGPGVTLWPECRRQILSHTFRHLKDTISNLVKILLLSQGKEEKITEQF